MVYSIQDFFAVVVIYNNPVIASTSLQSLNRTLETLKERLAVLIYDNSPQPQLGMAKEELSYLDINYYHDPANPGVSAAYNKGAEIANEIGKTFLLLLDQDTSFSPQFIHACLEAVNAFPGHSLFAPVLMSEGRIFSPCKFYFKKGWHLKQVTPGINSMDHITFLNSGMLIKLPAYNAVGGYDPSIRLYFSDFDFIDRLRKNEKEYILLDVQCQHELASNESVDVEKALGRFIIYCVDGRAAAKGTISRTLYFLTIFLRAVKLSIGFRHIGFLSIFWHRFILKKK